MDAETMFNGNPGCGNMPSRRGERRVYNAGGGGVLVEDFRVIRLQPEYQMFSGR
jgi:hypothetical protein